MIVACVAIVPLFAKGIPSGHDFEFHLNSWLEVVNQWKQGVIYPRWAEWAHYGYGEATFVFYPPASWLLGSLLGVLLPWKLAPGVYIWLALTLSGCSMFLLARQYFDARDSTWAAALYAINPYYILVIYWRSAYAELLAGALIPLLLLCVLRLESEKWRGAIPLALVLAGIWLTNAPSAVMANYSAALLLVVVSLNQRSPRIALVGLLGLVTGLLLAGFYVLPATYEQHWVNISQVLASGLRPQDNFLFTVLSDDVHNRFNRVISLVAIAAMLIFLGAGIRLWRRRQTSAIYWPLVAWGGMASFLIGSPSLFVWNHLPKLSFVQFPWRWLLCLNVPLTLLIALAWKRWAIRVAIFLGMLMVVAFGWQRIQSPWWDTAADVAEMQDNLDEGIGYEGTDEYVPVSADPSKLNQNARRVSLDGPGTARIHVTQWTAESKQMTAVLSASGKLVLRLFDFPAWRVKVNGNPVHTESQGTTGQMVVPLQAGENHIDVRLSRTWDRTLGTAISLLTGFGLLVFWQRSRMIKERA